jgi:hypothetical protein
MLSLGDEKPCGSYKNRCSSETFLKTSQKTAFFIANVWPLTPPKYCIRVNNKTELKKLAPFTPKIEGEKSCTCCR